MLASIAKDLSLNLSGTSAKTLILGGHMPGVSREVFFGVICRRCKISHFYLFVINIKN